MLLVMIFLPGRWQLEIRNLDNLVTIGTCRLFIAC